MLTRLIDLCLRNRPGVLSATLLLALIGLFSLSRLPFDRYPDEIRHIWTRTGTAEVATDPMGMEVSDVFITLTPRNQWSSARTQDELTASM